MSLNTSEEIADSARFQTGKKLAAAVAEAQNESRCRANLEIEIKNSENQKFKRLRLYSH